MGPGRMRQSQMALITDKMAINPKAERQPQWLPIHAPNGTPMTEATDQPKKTSDIALARFSTGTIWLTAAAACGVNKAGPTIAESRMTKSWV